jgi:hypothetical protein
LLGFVEKGNAVKGENITTKDTKVKHKGHKGVGIRKSDALEE